MSPANRSPAGPPSFVKAPTDKKEYRLTRLPNGMLAILVHDPEIVLSEEGEDGAGERRPTDDRSMRSAPLSEAEDGESMSEEEDDDNEEDGEGSGGEGSPLGSLEGGESSEEGEAARALRTHPAGAAQGEKRAAAAVSVGIGSFSDPQDLPGLSHLLEHMLFMGSERFPEENEYDQFLQMHGGSSNAFTDAEMTTYYFEVRPAYLRGALEVFAGFFTGPLLKETSIEREVEAVDNEFALSQQSDTARLGQMACSSAVPGHTYGNFSWGDKRSLWDGPRSRGIDVRARVLDHYLTHYGAERMTLVLLGGQSLDELEGWAKELFAATPGSKGPRPSFRDAGMPFADPPLMFLAPSVKTQHVLGLLFQLPPLIDRYRCKAEDYVSHLVGHEGKGSLLSALKARGLATALAAGVELSGENKNTAYSLFTIHVTLTDAGVSDMGAAATELVFGYIRMLTEGGPEKWVWEELRAVSEMRFRYAEEEFAGDLVLSLAVNAHLYPPHHALYGDYAYEEYDEQLIRTVLTHLAPTAPGLRVVLSTTRHADLAPAFQGNVGHEPWFGLDYQSRPIAAETIQRWAQCRPSPDMHLPMRNDFIATDFDVRPIDPSPPTLATIPRPPPTLLLRPPPSLLISALGLRLWHKRDDQFALPKAIVHAQVSSAALHASPRHIALAVLCHNLLENSLSEISYMADMGGVSYTLDLSTPSQGLDIRVQGFSDKLPRLATLILDHLTNLPERVTQEDFARVKEALLKRFQDLDLKPGKQAHSLRLFALRPDSIPSHVTRAEAQSLTQSDIGPYLREVLGCTHLEVYVHGNVAVKEAVALAENLRGVLDGAETGDALPRMPETDRPLDHVILVPSGHHEWSVVGRNPDEDNSAVEAYYQAEADVDGKERVLSELAEQVLFEPFFDTLRTKEQLGYSVSCGARHTHGMVGFGAQISSSRHSWSHLRDRLDRFFQEHRSVIAAMSDGEFEKHRAVMRAFKCQRDVGMGDDAARTWCQIASRRFEFFSRERDVLCLDRITKHDLLEWYDRVLCPDKGLRRAVVVGVEAMGRAGGEWVGKERGERGVVGVGGEWVGLAHRLHLTSHRL